MPVSHVHVVGPAYQHADRLRAVAAARPVFADEVRWRNYADYVDRVATSAPVHTNGDGGGNEGLAEVSAAADDDCDDSGDDDAKEAGRVAAGGPAGHGDELMDGFADPVAAAVQSAMGQTPAERARLEKRRAQDEKALAKELRRAKAKVGAGVA